jgi:DNA-binding MarR family transcriptional regulator
MHAPDEVIHQSLRLRVMAALHAEPAHAPLDFARLKRLVQATDGNLGSHLTTLEKAGYVRIEKDFHDRRPRTRVFITRDGARAFRDHVAYLRDVLDAAAPAETNLET